MEIATTIFALAMGIFTFVLALIYRYQQAKKKKHAIAIDGTTASVRQALEKVQAIHDEDHAALRELRRQLAVREKAVR